MTTIARMGTAVVAVAMALGSMGCASMMMQVKDVGGGGADVKLDKGDSVAIEGPKLAIKVKNKEASAAVTKELKEHLAQEFEERGVKVGSSGDATLEITVTKFKKGCGFCRGFFPVFGLGNSYLDGEVVLKTDGGERNLTVTKRGQISGTSQMGDQTGQNAKFFAKALARKVCSEGSAEDEGKKSKKK